LGIVTRGRNSSIRKGWRRKKEKTNKNRKGERSVNMLEVPCIHVFIIHDKYNETC
jgi:hypothetical protein